MFRTFLVLCQLVFFPLPAWACPGGNIADGGQVAITSLLALLGMAILVLPLYGALLALKAMFYRKLQQGGVFRKLTKAHLATAVMVSILGAVYFIFDEFLKGPINKILLPPSTRNSSPMAQALRETGAYDSWAVYAIHYSLLPLIFILLYRADRKLIAALAAAGQPGASRIVTTVGNALCSFVLWLVIAMATNAFCGSVAKLPQ